MNISSKGPYSSGFDDFDPPQGYRPISTFDYEEDFGVGGRGNSRSGNRDSFEKDDKGIDSYAQEEEEEVTHFKVAAAKVYQSFDKNDLTNEDYEKRQDLQLKVSFRNDGFMIYSDFGYGTNSGDFYRYNEIKKINHKRGPDGNFLNLIMARNSNLCFCTPESVHLKATFLEFIKKRSNLRVADYRSNHN